MGRTATLAPVVVLFCLLTFLVPAPTKAECCGCIQCPQEGECFTNFTTDCGQCDPTTCGFFEDGRSCADLACTSIDGVPVPSKAAVLSACLASKAP